MSNSTKSNYTPDTGLYTALLGYGLNEISIGSLFSLSNSDVKGSQWTLETLKPSFDPLPTMPADNFIGSADFLMLVEAGWSLP